MKYTKENYSVIKNCVTSFEAAMKKQLVEIIESLFDKVCKDDDDHIDFGKSIYVDMSQSEDDGVMWAFDFIAQDDQEEKLFISEYCGAVAGKYMYIDKLSVNELIKIADNLKDNLE